VSKHSTGCLQPSQRLTPPWQLQLSAVVSLVSSSNLQLNPVSSTQQSMHQPHCSSSVTFRGHWLCCHPTHIRLDNVQVSAVTHGAHACCPVDAVRNGCKVLIHSSHLVSLLFTSKGHVGQTRAIIMRIPEVAGNRSGCVLCNSTGTEGNALGPPGSAKMDCFAV